MSVYYYDRQKSNQISKSIFPLILFLISIIFIYFISLIFSLGNKTITMYPLIDSRKITKAVSVLGNNTDLSSKSLIEQTNEFRASKNISPLGLSYQLNKSAELKCQDLVNNNYWAHLDKYGREPLYFAKFAGYNNAAFGENLAYGFDNSHQIIEGWKSSEEHKKLLLDSNYSDVGFAICESNNFINQGKQTIIVQHLGRQMKSQ